MDDSALELAKLINSPDFQRRLNDLVRERKAAEDAIAKAQSAKAETELTITALNELRTKQQAEMAAATANHDKAADEAAKRIALANDLDARNKEASDKLNARQDDLSKRESLVETIRAQFESALQHLGLLKT